MLDDGRWQGRRVLPAGWVARLTEPSSPNAHFGYQVFLGRAWLDPAINRRAAAPGFTGRPASTEHLFYLSGAGNLQLMIVPEAQLVYLRVGGPSPAWHDEALVNALLAGIVPQPQ
jgi:hypothetical protein